MRIFFRFRAHLIEELARQRVDFERQLRDRDEYVRDLRDELAAARAKIERMEIVLMPLVSAPPRPRPVLVAPPDDSWEATLAEHMKQVEAEEESNASVSGTQTEKAVR